LESPEGPKSDAVKDLGLRRWPGIYELWLGVLAMQYYPQIAGSLGIPTLIIGIAFLIFAAKGMTRKEVPKG
jgi:hypothetical protein